MCHINVVVGSKETSSCYNAFQKQLAFFPASLYLPQLFSTAQTSERIGWEGTSLFHTHSLLLENSFPPLPLSSHLSSVWKNKVWRESLHDYCPDVSTQYHKLCRLVGVLLQDPL